MKNVNDFSGFLNIYKEAGFTSHDVVSKLRKILRQRKIGHMGTLDPDAEGVLPIALGNATKAINFIEDHSKGYDVCLLLGIETDTYDLTGTITNTCEVSVDQDSLIRTIQSFVGNQMQIPPMYSAKKINGKKLYEYARKGIEIERKPCPITIFTISIIKIHLPEIVLHVDCSKGTYIRSLCHDIGHKLGCGGCMKKLIRTQSCGFKIQHSIKIDDLDPSHIPLIPIDQMFCSCDKFICKPFAHKKAINGNVLFHSDINFLSTKDMNTELVESSILFNDCSDLSVINNANDEMSVTIPSINKNISKSAFLINERKLNGCALNFAMSDDPIKNVDKIHVESRNNNYVLVYLDNRKFLGIYEWIGEKLTPRKVFYCENF